MAKKKLSTDDVEIVVIEKPKKTRAKKEEPTPAEKAKKTKKMKGFFSKFIVLLVITLNVLFTIKMFEVLPTLSFEPSVFIASWFGFTSSELVVLGSITKAGYKKKEEQ